MGEDYCVDAALAMPNNTFPIEKSIILCLGRGYSKADEGVIGWNNFELKTHTAIRDFENSDACRSMIIQEKKKQLNVFTNVLDTCFPVTDSSFYQLRTYTYHMHHLELLLLTKFLLI